MIAAVSITDCHKVNCILGDELEMALIVGKGYARRAEKEILTIY